MIVPDKNDCEYILRLQKFVSRTRVAAGEITDFEYYEQIGGGMMDMSAQEIFMILARMEMSIMA